MVARRLFIDLLILRRTQFVLEEHPRLAKEAWITMVTLTGTVRVQQVFVLALVLSLFGLCSGGLRMEHYLDASEYGLCNWKRWHPRQPKTMGVFRSEKMLLCQLLLSQESAFACIEVLGNTGLVQFRDLNAPVTQYQRRYVGDIRRCEEMERKIRILEEEIRKSETPIRECKEIPPAPGAKETLSLETNLETLVAEMGNVNKSRQVLKRNLVELVEHYHVVKNSGLWLQPNNLVLDEERRDAGGNREGAEDKCVGHLKITTGVIQVGRIRPFEMLVWRICRGVAFVRIVHIAPTLAEPGAGEKTEKAVFVIVCQGDNLNSKILKICEAFHCSLYLSPTSPERRRELEKETLSGISDTQQVIEQTEDHRKRILLAAATNLEKWKLQVLKLKSIYHVMNMLQLDEINEFQTAECWIPQSDLPSIRSKLVRAAERINNQNDPIIIVKSHYEQPPTFNRTNKFVKAFQALVDSYGVCEYSEANPMPYTVVTFPFLFAVMFGDVGHGIVLTVFATFLVLYEDKLKSKSRGEIQKLFFEGRYVLLLMGIFSCYTGLIYNDFFSKSVKLFSSSWRITHNASEVSQSRIQLDPASHFNGRSYVFGIDPIWQCSDNKIIFLNSFKMKVSIILGVLHMCFGLVLGASNHLRSGKFYNIYAEVVPEIVYFSCLFVYLVFLILAKWALFDPLLDGAHCAPNILITFIDMIMFKEGGHPAGCSLEMYPHQGMVQTALVTLAILSVPWLFVAKAAVLLQQKRSLKEEAKNEKGRDLTLEDFDCERSDFGEILIHQGIRTIEFVLGSVSHTASYLRLWALSLAHAQLSDVLWKMVMRVGIGARGNVAGLSVCVCFAVWASLTVGILVLMEGLSAFLHALRLHWVEFQSKFYSGTGHPFKPYSFEKILDVEYDPEGFD